MAERVGPCIGCSPPPDFTLHRTSPLLHASDKSSNLFLKASILPLLLSLLITLYASYNLFIHPLRHYPGPLFWRAFSIPRTLSLRKGTLELRLKAFHERYGPVIRIAPNELSYTDPQAWDDIFLNRPNNSVFPRSPLGETWTTQLNNVNSIMGSDEEAHAKLRRIFAPAFTDKSLRDQSPIIESHVDALIQQLDRQSQNNSRVDLVTWLEYLCFDISGDLSFGESFDCIKNGKLHPWVKLSQDVFAKGHATIPYITHNPPLSKLLTSILPNKTKQQTLDHQALTTSLLQKRLSTSTTRPDFNTPIQTHTSKTKDTLSIPQWSLNMTQLALTGSQKTHKTLCVALFHLLQNRGAMCFLAQEIRQRFDKEGDITVASTANLEYLNAVINESLRLEPPVVLAPRVVPKGGATVCGRWVPENTTLTIPQPLTNLHPPSFHAPNTFIPERFLSPSKPNTTKDNLSTLHPFALGRHTCLGQKLAYAQIRLTLAKLSFVFDMRLDEGYWAMKRKWRGMGWENRALWVRVKRGGPVLNWEQFASYTEAL